MSDKQENFIFRRSHRRLTYLSLLSVLPILITALAAGLVWLADMAIATQALEYILALPTWVLAILWIVLPVISVIFARRAAQHGTLYQLRSWNTFTYKLALALLGGEVVVILMSIF